MEYIFHFNLFLFYFSQVSIWNVWIIDHHIRTCVSILCLKVTRKSDWSLLYFSSVICHHLNVFRRNFSEIQWICVRRNDDSLSESDWLLFDDWWPLFSIGEFRGLGELETTSDLGLWRWMSESRDLIVDRVIVSNPCHDSFLIYFYDFISMHA